jgi:hypothetical protein
MPINRVQPDPEHFLIREQDDLRLITPKSSAAFDDQIWNPDNLQFRSRVETLDGETVSQGFKKFMNLGQGPDGVKVDTAAVVAACARGDAVATLKIDGSLIVRSVHQGRIVQRYPRLLDPGYRPDISLLLEWVSPTNVIIFKYDEAELILVDGIRHDNYQYLQLDELQPIAADLGISLVEFFRLDQNGWADLYASLATDKDKEGYVIRINHEQDLVKVKCAPYLAKHAFKYNMSTGKLVDMWLHAERPSEQVFVEQLTHQFDEETIMWALPFIANLFSWVRAVTEHAAEIEQKVDQLRHLPRKDFAIQMKAELSSRDFSLAMLFWDKRDINDRLMRQMLEQESTEAEVPTVVGEAG